MFQRYIHPASVDPEAPFVSKPTDAIALDLASGSSSVFFDDAPCAPSYRLNRLDLARDAAALSVNICTATQPTGLTSCFVVFFDIEENVLGQVPVWGNGLGTHQDCVDIPKSAYRAAIYCRGFPDINGHVRIVTREVIPYQPLKG